MDEVAVTLEQTEQHFAQGIAERLLSKTPRYIQHHDVQGGVDLQTKDWQSVGSGSIRGTTASYLLPARHISPWIGVLKPPSSTNFSGV